MIYADLALYLQSLATAPMVWGQNDCCMMAADWILGQKKVDVAAGFRGTYATEAEAEVLIERAGGLVPFASNLMAAQGFEPTDAPRLGDVGVITVTGKETVAIKVQAGWAFKSDRGVSVLRLDPVAAWAVKCPS